MEQKALPVIFSANTLEALEAIHEYGAETFSPAIASKYVSNLIVKLDALSNSYWLHAECRFLRTKSKRYRMFAFSPYLVVYRITEEHVAVLAIIHKSRSISTIRATRRIKV